MKIFISVLCVLVLCSVSVYANTLEGKVTGVLDGSNIIVDVGGRSVPVRLFCIDCPILSQSYGQEAKAFVEAMVLGKEVSVDVRDSDHSNRLISRVTSGGRDLSCALVNAGLAWYDGRRSYDPGLAAAHRMAKDQRAGLWADKDPEAPWVFRRKSAGIAPDFTVGYYGASGGSPTAAAPARVCEIPARSDYGFVPLKDQTCESSFGISVLSVPAYGPFWGPCGYGGYACGPVSYSSICYPYGSVSYRSCSYPFGSFYGSYGYGTTMAPFFSGYSSSWGWTFTGSWGGSSQCGGPQNCRPQHGHHNCGPQHGHQNCGHQHSSPPHSGPHR